MGSTLSKATADKEKIIIMLSGSDVSPEDADKCAKIFSSSAPSLKTAVEVLFSSIKGKTLPEFKLNPGCSIVCPLIAFLEGSGGDKPENTTRKGNCEAHQVTYNFGMENISSSKLKVASFAPLQQ